MVLDDAPLSDLTPERFRAALAPKLLGALNLHRVTHDRNLDLFVAFSSATATVGNPGQSNYAAGNLFLEALVRKRKRAGLPGLAIAWGAIDEVGYLARNAALGESVASRLGVQPIAPIQALAALEDLLAAGADVVTVGRYDWASMHQALPSLSSPRFAQVMPAGTAETRQDTGELRRLLHGLSAENAVQLVEEVAAQTIADILRTAPERLDRNRHLGDLGIDSLMAGELEVALEHQFGCSVPTMEIIGTRGIRDLALVISSRLGFESAVSPETAVVNVSSHASDALGRDHE
jgi:acyl carrier protein